ncbi:MAG: 30S ribosomal protein S18 [Candidatus Villigracilaceae bacterium]
MPEDRVKTESNGDQMQERRYYARPKVCQFCTDKQLTIDYKKIDLLRRFITDDGKIRPRRQTGICARHQRQIAIAVKRARHIALLPYTGKYWEEGYS